ncbi:hypothetical protein [Micromonospora aurantiaca (nom. illeg.)]|uniref:hypothetical protein n=1 Tax=Micromonospora aurantiaca (nom. illeg.) TaxID=47850 RepID=UPI0011A61D8A|nr:hypothetical protein [Micromonospora aurantiaca]MBC9000494.1 hypothetical protein [Micromonospora aurantiaca]
MSRRLLTSRRARDITGAVLLAAGVLTVAAAAVVAAFGWHPLAGAALAGGLTAGVGFLLGRE